MEVSASPLQASGGVMCAQHTTAPARYSCQRCSTPMCSLCAFEMNGAFFCPNCITAAAAAAPLPPTVGFVPPQYTPYAPGPVLPPGARCVQHQNVTATQICKVCGAFMCATCDFTLTGGVHVCPAC